MRFRLTLAPFTDEEWEATTEWWYYTRTRGFLYVRLARWTLKVEWR